MASLNKVMLIGNLGSDPEVKTTGGGQTVASLSVATNERWTDGDGMKQERTEWHKVVVWGRQADFCGQYLQKGCTVFIEGRIQTRSWDDKEGQKRYTTEIVATNVLIISSRQGGVADAAERAADRDAPTNPDAATIREGYQAPAAKPVVDDDVPF